MLNELLKNDKKSDITIDYKCDNVYHNYRSRYYVIETVQCKRQMILPFLYVKNPHEIIEMREIARDNANSHGGVEHCPAQSVQKCQRQRSGVIQGFNTFRILAGAVVRRSFALHGGE